MFNIINPDTRFDFMSKAAAFTKASTIAFIGALVVIFAPIEGVGLKFGLDFSGGHELLVSFDENVAINDVRVAVKNLNLGDTAVQSFEIPDSPKTHYLVKVQRSETFGEQELAGLNAAFDAEYGDRFKAPLDYDPEIGNIIEVTFTSSLAASSTTAAGTSTTTMVAAIDTSSAALALVVEKTDHRVRLVRRVGRPDEHKFAIVLMGVDVSVIGALKSTVHASALAERVEYVGPTVGKQLRDDGILACLYALLCILIYIALRFDFYFAPGAIVCLFHDAVITTGILSLMQHEFSLATIAGLLTLIGYSINDTIVVYDRIRERIGKAHGSALFDVLNRAINETLGRTLMTSFTTGFACVCLMWFGRKTVLFDFGLIMGIGVIIGTYSSIYVASPTFLRLRQRFGQQQIVGAAKKPARSGAASR